MRVDLNVPRGMNCLSFGFRFLSEEFPELVHDAFNAELGRSDWDDRVYDSAVFLDNFNTARHEGCRSGVSTTGG